ncbi:MAG TPA: DNA polymerase I [Verrucomicrobiae bacterium]|nr:DNA polymerase I [Verrucomicrobiae bacterium]
MNRVTGKKVLAVIDGKSVFYRGYYAMPGLSTKEGTPTGGVYGFAVMALQVIKQIDPEYVAVAWDKPKTNIRRRLELYPAYKAGRKPAPPDFHVQIPLLHDLLEAFGWPLYEFDDYEADDIMGTLAVQAKEQDIETMLITSDLDMLQLINPLVHVYALKKGLSNIELYSPESFQAKYGIRTDQFLDLKALKGDSSDNIPGVPGIGEKGALDLLKQFETLDGVYENLALIKDSTAKKLEAGKESAYLSKKLADIWTNAPVTLDLKEVDGSKCDPVRVRQTLEKLEFRTLAQQLPKYMHVPEEQGGPKETAKLVVGDHTVIDSKAALEKLTLPKADELVLYSISSTPHGREPVSLTVSPDPKTVITFDLTAMDDADVGNKLRDYIEGAKLVGYNLKNSLQLLKTLGIQAGQIQHDVLIGAFLINSLRREQTLGELAAADLNIHLPEDEDTATADIIAVIRGLHVQQQKDLTKMPKVAQLAQDVEWPIISVLADMEYEGIQLDTNYLVRMSDQINDMISDLEQQIYGHADNEFNIGSPAQLADILFNTLQLPTQGIKKGKTGYSTAATELDKLRPVHPIIDLITQWREVSKLKNTYVDTLPKQVDDNSRLHTTYALTVAQTGRLSSNEPNLQNIPVRTDLGKQIRTAFVAGPGNLLVSADYSQQELRLAAYLADDQELIDLFNRDVDVHTATAAEVYGRKPEDVTKNMRRDAKVVNFGVMYGLSTHGLVAATGMTYEQAGHFIKKYFEVRPKLLAYIESVKEQAKKDGYTETIMGRRRPTPDVHSSNFMVREAAIRAAVNMPFQGSAADLTKLAMVRIQQQLKSTDCKMLLQIHDSVIVECPEAEADRIAKLLKSTMEGAQQLPVKLTVDTSVGKNWGEL